MYTVKGNPSYQAKPSVGHICRREGFGFFELYECDLIEDTGFRFVIKQIQS